MNWTLPSTWKSRLRISRISIIRALYSLKLVEWLGLVSIFPSREAVTQMYSHKKVFWKYAVKLHEQIHGKIWFK